jgi:serine/threonine-protein kinase HipA
MKMAMAVGKSRHYSVDSIARRHFEQTADLCGYPALSLSETVDELRDTANTLIDTALDQLPKGFPDGVAASIVAAARRRLDLLTAPSDAAKSIMRES